MAVINWTDPYGDQPTFAEIASKFQVHAPDIAGVLGSIMRERERQHKQMEQVPKDLADALEKRQQDTIANELLRSQYGEGAGTGGVTEFKLRQAMAAEDIKRMYNEARAEHLAALTSGLTKPEDPNNLDTLIKNERYQKMIQDRTTPASAAEDIKTQFGGSVAPADFADPNSATQVGKLTQADIDAAAAKHAGHGLHGFLGMGTAGTTNPLEKANVGDWSPYASSLTHREIVTPSGKARYIPESTFQDFSKRLTPPATPKIQTSTIQSPAGVNQPVIKTPEEAAQLPSGTLFRDLDGNVRRVP